MRSNKISLDYNNIPGWSAPAVSGFTLNAYQKTGVEFCASRGMRALLADEMGVGKTAQAIACAKGVHSKRVLILCPQNAVTVWVEEIHNWRLQSEPEPLIYHLKHFRRKISSNAQWILINYDKLISRPIEIPIFETTDQTELRKCLPEGVKLVISKKGKLYLQIQRAIEPPCNLKLSINFGYRWHMASERLRKREAVINSLLGNAPDFLILDEAHYLKNISSKRTIAAHTVAQSIAYVIALTGTPIRNHQSDAASIVSFLDHPLNYSTFAKKGTLSILTSTEKMVSTSLKQFMLRRKKTDVLNNLPPKIRQWVPLEIHESAMSRELMKSYDMFLSLACQGDSDSIGIKQIGALEKAAAILAQLKVLDGQIADFVSNLVLNRQCCIVFGRHLAAMDMLADQLATRGMRVVRIDGRTQITDRQKAVERFQGGDAEVFLGSFRAGGESITLTRSDTCIFYELPFVPAEILQAEDRGHRLGQASSHYHVKIFHAVDMVIDDILVELHAKKLACINRVLDEDLNIFIESGKNQISFIREVAERVRDHSHITI